MKRMLSFFTYLPQNLKGTPVRLFAFLDKRPVTFLIMLSLFLNCVIEFLGRRSFFSFAQHALTRPHVFLFNSFIILCTLSVTLFVKRRAFIVMIVSSVWLAFGIINCALMSLRTSPFTARDIFLAGDGLKLAGVYFSPLQITLMISGFAAFLILAVISFFKLPKCTARLNFSRIIISVSALSLILICAITFVTSNVALASDYDNVLDAYDDFGFAYCFADSLFNTGIDKPADYSRDSVLEVLDWLPQRSVPPEHLPNIVIVQLESFFDPALLNGLSFSENPVPVFSSLKENYHSGHLSVPSLGGGTANTEFEVLTGMSLSHFGFGEYPYDSVLRNRSCESIAYCLKDIGYTAHAIHNHEATFYARHIVYQNLGFDSFLSLEYMSNVEYTQTGWAKDAVLNDHILETLQIAEQPALVFTVSVQGHGKYPTDFMDYNISVEEMEDYAFDDAALPYFIAQLHEMDAFIGELIKDIETLGEDTVLVVYGDHLPPLGMSADQLTTGSLYQTEYVIWNNFGLNAENYDLRSSELSAYILDLLDINSGILTRFHQAYPQNDNWDHAYKTLEYDLVFGEMYASNGENINIPAEMMLGRNNITISAVIKNSSSFYVQGENFTPFSVIYVNGRRMDTLYLSPELLNTNTVIADGDIVTVCQTGPDTIILSSTDDYTFKG